MTRALRQVFVVGSLAVFAIGCSAGQIKKTVSDSALHIPATQAWTPTGLVIAKGKCLELSASGKITIDQRWRGPFEVYDFQSGPQGTYVLSQEALTQAFPMESGYFGPVPGYALIGKVGEKGKVFYVGERWAANCDEASRLSEAGELYLGINDYRLDDNSGEFLVSVGFARDPSNINPISSPIISPPLEETPVRGSTPRILTIYIDGLRPDVLYEMAYNGFLPNIRKYFFDRGVFYNNAFTMFPSDTVTSNSAWMTGLFTDKTAVKSQTEFDRQTGEINTLLDKFAPTDSANRLRLVDEFRFAKYVALGWNKMFGSKARVEELRAELHTGVKAIYDYAEDAGMGFHSGSLPILNPHPPRGWINVFSNNVRWPISAIEGVQAFDKTNADYINRYGMDYRSRIMHVWFPGNDVTGHFSARGQFASARRYIQEADRWIGQLVARLERRDMLKDTYLVLMADHGHIGGKDFINQRFNLPYDLFFLPPRDDDHDGVIDDGSGLGFNVHKYDYRREHNVNDERDFAAFDIGSYGTAKVFLPFASRTSKVWSKRNGWQQLSHYQVADGFAPVDLIDRILKLRPREKNLYPEMVADDPVAFVMVPVSGLIAAPSSGAHDDPVNRLYLRAPNGSEALIEAQYIDGGWQYRYVPIAKFSQSEAGELSYVTRGVQADPLGYLKTLKPGFLGTWHDGRAWLKATAENLYPDAPELFFKYFDWDPAREQYRERKTPDLVIAANPGWSMRHEDVLSTDHGFAQRDSLHIPMLVSGPGTKKGVVISEPVLITDLVPTMLGILKIPYDASVMDGKPLPGLYEGEAIDPAFKQTPNALEQGADLGHHYFLGLESDMKWNDVFAWKPPEPVDVSFHMHDLSRYGDVHNIVLDVWVLGSYEIPYGLDVLVDLCLPGENRRLLTHGVNWWLDTWDQVPDAWWKRRTGQFFNALHLRELSVLDVYSIYSTIAGDAFTPVPVTLNFLDRYLDLVDWGEDLLLDFSGVISRPLGYNDLLGMRYVNFGIDTIQWPIVFAERMLTKYGLDLADRGLLKGEAGISYLVNRSRHKDKPVVLQEFPGHVGCSCNVFIERMRKGETGTKSKQGGKGLKIPAPGVPM